MIVVTGREFRSSQSKYLNIAKQGEDVIIKSRAGSFRIMPVKKEDMVYNIDQLSEMIDNSMRQVKEGNCYPKREDETSEEFINRLLNV